MLTTQEEPHIEPRLIEMSDGSWLAIVGAGGVIRAGAVGPTAHTARLHFQEAVKRAVRLAEREGAPEE